MTMNSRLQYLSWPHMWDECELVWRMHGYKGRLSSCPGNLGKTSYMAVIDYGKSHDDVSYLECPSASACVDHAPVSHALDLFHNTLTSYAFDLYLYASTSVSTSIDST